MGLVPSMLQPENLLGLYEKFASETGSALLQWFPDRPSTESGQTVMYDILDYSRDVATIVSRGAEPKPIEKPVMSTRTVRAITLSEQNRIEGADRKDHRGPGLKGPSPLEVEVAQILRNMRKRINKRKAIFAAQCFGTASGNISFTLPDTNITETVALDHPTGHNAIGTAWGTAATNIITDIEAAKVKIREASGKEPTELVLNTTTMGYLRANDWVKAYLSDEAKNQMMQGILDKICGLNIHIIDEVYAADTARSSTTKLIPDAHVSIFAGDNADRGMLETEPASEHAPAGYRGAFFYSFQEPGIQGAYRIQSEYNLFPLLAVPGEIVYDTNVNG